MNPDDFRKIRKAGGLTQGQIAERIGVSRLTINNWEGAKFRIPDDILDTLATKGLLEAPKAKGLSTRARDTLANYTKMREPPHSYTHLQIVQLWAKSGYQLNDEEKLAILNAHPDIIINGKTK